MNKVGRPTDYSDELCEKVVELLMEGASMKEIALELRQAVSTLYLWMDKYPQFMESVKGIGRDFSEGWWLREGRKSLRDKNFNATLWYMNMKNRFGWTDRQNIIGEVGLLESERRIRDADSKYDY